MTTCMTGRQEHQPHGSGRIGRQLLAGTAQLLGRLTQGVLAAAVLTALLGALPWALWHYIGWPLPTRLPTAAQLQALLLSPMTTQFLLDVLACLCWITWAAFTLDVARCAADAARGVHWPNVAATGPLHTIAAVLVSAIMLSILGHRSITPPPSAPWAITGTGTAVITTTAVWHPEETTVHTTALTTHAVPATAAQPESVVVQAPRGGVHDSLWRIAERTLGNGARWPEIFALNKGKPQPHGGTFTTPSLIFPGEELALPPHTSTPPLTALPPVGAPQPAPLAAPPPPSPATPPTGTAHSAPTNPDATPGLQWGPELFLGLSLATAISTALLITRRRYRRTYRPGSGRRDDLSLAPVVYQLRLAHLRQQPDNQHQLDSDDQDRQHHERVPDPPALVIGDTSPSPNTSGSPQPVVLGLGVRDGHQIALNLATARGLGLVGAGAPAAARALLLAALTTSPNPTGHSATSVGARVIVPTEDLALLLGPDQTRPPLPAGLHVATSLNEALDELETHTLLRTNNTEQTPWQPMILFTRPPEHNYQRLQAVLDNGADFGLVGVLLGQWQPGITAYIRTDGTVSATSPGLGQALRGTSMFHLPATETAELLALLHHAHPEQRCADERTSASVSQPHAVSTVPRRKQPTPDGQGEISDRRHATNSELEITATHAPATDTESPIPGPQPVPAPGARLDPTPLSHHHLVAAIDDASHTALDAPPESDSKGTTATPGTTGTTTPVPIRITVLGVPRVYWHPNPADTSERDITGALAPRVRELLVFLALHPEGATREALVAALWAGNPPERPTNALNTALSRLRRSLATATEGALSDITSTGEGRYRLDPALVHSDYWRFTRAVAARRAACSDQERIDAYREVIHSYSGALAEGMPFEWIEAAREATRRDALDAVAALARALVDHDPQQTLDLLEIARAFDPHNELLYRDIMRLQERLGQLDAIPRTLTLLTTRLAEINDQPTPQTTGLASRLLGHHDTTSTHQKLSTAQQRDDRRGSSAAS